MSHAACMRMRMNSRPARSRWVGSGAQCADDADDQQPARLSCWTTAWVNLPLLCRACSCLRALVASLVWAAIAGLGACASGSFGDPILVPLSSLQANGASIALINSTVYSASSCGGHTHYLVYSTPTLSLQRSALQGSNR